MKNLVFAPPALGTVLSLTGLPGGSNKIHDRSPYGNHGTTTGATWKRLASGLWCLSFDGTDDRADCGKGSSFDLGDMLTIKVWIWVDSTGSGYRSVTGNYNSPATRAQYLLDVNNSRNYRFVSESSGGNFAVTSAGIIPNEAWTHLVATRESATGTVKLYMNGAQDDNTGTSVANKIGAFADCGNTALGRAGSYDGSYFKGRMALVEVTKTLWTPLDVINSHNQEKHLFGVC